MAGRGEEEEERRRGGARFSSPGLIRPRPTRSSAGEDSLCPGLMMGWSPSGAVRDRKQQDSVG